MKFLLIPSLLGLSLLLSCSKDHPTNSAYNCPEQNLVVIAPQQHVPTQYIAMIDPAALTGVNLKGIGQATKHLLILQFIQQKLAQDPITAGVEPTAVFTNIFQGFSGALTPEQLGALEQAAWIKQIEPAGTFRAFDCQTGPFDLSASQLTSYGVVKTHSANGVGKRIWILDSGVQTDHPDLTVNATLGRNFVSSNVLGVVNTDAGDDNGHGTHVAGIAAAKDNTIGTKGVAAGAEIVSVKVLDANGESTANSVLLGLDYILATANPGEVVNISLGGESSTLYDLAVQALGNKGIFVVMAAGNDSQTANNYSPGRANGPNLFTVSAIDQSNRFAAYSNFGNPPIDYAEPGSSILSTYLDGQYRYLSGTSMAAPHLAGILLLQGKNFSTDGFAFGDPDGTFDPIAVLKLN